MTVLQWLDWVEVSAGDVWSLRTPTVLELGPRPAIAVAIGVAVFAGVATMLGHAVAFAINRVTGVRMVVGVVLGAVYIAVLRAVAATVIGLLTLFVSQGRVSGVAFAVAYLLAAAPHIFGFFVFIPHVGLLIGRLLEIWMLVCLAGLIVNVLGIDLVVAVVMTGGAWVVARLVSQLLARPTAVLTSRAWSIATGHDTFLTTQDILAGAPFLPLERQEPVR